VVGKDLKFRSSYIYLCLVAWGVLLAGFFLYEEWAWTGSLNGVALDDSWIHFRFADNLRSGLGFSFNPGMSTPGSTSPLWVIVLSIFDHGYIIPAKLIGILSYLGTGLVVYWLASSGGIKRSYAFLGAISALAAGRLIWAAPSGMETTTFTLLTLVALWLWHRDAEKTISPVTSLVFGLACLLRPEGYLLLVSSGVVWLVTSNASLKDREGWMDVARHFMIAGLMILPYLLFGFVTTGNLLPNTFYAKTSAWGCRPSPLYFGWIGPVFLLDNPILALMAAIGLGTLLRSRNWKDERLYTLCGLWLVGLPVLYGFMAPCISGYYTRYTTPLIPVMMILGAVGGQRLESTIPKWLAKLRNKTPSDTRPPLIAGLMVEGIILAMLPTILFWAPFYAQSVADIEDMQMQIGHWLSQNSKQGDVLALNDIGAIGYIANREVIDLGGLISPQVLPLIRGKGPGEWDYPLADYLAAKRPDYLAIFPNWYPELAELVHARPVYRVRLESRSIAGIPDLTIVGGGVMVVYRLDWTNVDKP
jgi:hypothetical protein